MHIANTIAELRAHLAKFQSPTFVPTMGNLHDGHLKLVRKAKKLGDVTVVSIFVNRLQFLPLEDFDAYPRTWEADCQKLIDAGCDILFAPEEGELFPQPQTFKVQPPAQMADILEGHFRPGFFVGVCTIVLKLLACVQPRVALFGSKDFQQLMVIRAMVAQFALPIEIVGCEIVRDQDGLALSSRNSYLSADERLEALQLPWALQAIAGAIRAGASITDIPALEVKAMADLQTRGWQPDYLVVRRRQDLQAPQWADSPSDWVVLGAARIGKTRLVDNVDV